MCARCSSTAHTLKRAWKACYPTTCLSPLARALARPAELLLDEPLAGLDVGAQEDLERLLRDLVDQGSALLVATHDLHHVTHSYDAVLCLNGRVIAQGPPETALTEEALQETFGRGLVLLDVAGKTYGIQG